MSLDQLTNRPAGTTTPSSSAVTSSSMPTTTTSTSTAAAAAKLSKKTESAQDKKARKRSCHHCQIAHASCDNKAPCSRCSRLGRAHLCYYTAPKKRGRKRKLSEEELNMDVDTPVREILMTVLTEMRDMKEVQARLEDQLALLLADRQNDPEGFSGFVAAAADLSPNAPPSLSSASALMKSFAAASASATAKLSQATATAFSACGASPPPRTLSHPAQGEDQRPSKRISVKLELPGEVSGHECDGQVSDLCTLLSTLQARCTHQQSPSAVLTFCNADPFTPPTIMDCNRAFESLIGFPLDDLRGRPYLELVYPESREATHSDLCTFWAAQENNDLEVRGTLRLLTKDTGFVDLACSTMIYYNEAGHAAACLISGVTATPMHSDRLFSLIAEHTPVLSRSSLPPLFSTTSTPITPSSHELPVSPFAPTTTPVGEEDSPTLSAFTGPEMTSSMVSLQLGDNPFAHPFLSDFSTV
jgi:PAS domain-containing protein